MTLIKKLEGGVSGTEDGRGKGHKGEVMGNQWEQHWELKLELREVPMMYYQEGMGVSDMRTIKWGYNGSRLI